VEEDFERAKQIVWFGALFYVPFEGRAELAVSCCAWHLELGPWSAVAAVAAMGTEVAELNGQNLSYPLLY